jgi:hypothetical protein
MGISANDERQLLEISDSMRQTNGDFLSNVICALNQAIVRHMSSKEDQLTHGIRIYALLDVAIQYFVVVEAFGRRGIVPTLVAYPWRCSFTT